MQVAFASSHCVGDFGSGELLVDIARDDPATGFSARDRVSFSVPPDYHAHNDCVAAALLALVGASCREVRFDFPISAQCAAILRGYYELEEIGPVDEALEPRRPGRNLAINFSGGTDSTALYLLLQEVLGDEFKVITFDFGGRFVHERIGFSRFPRHVTCRTNLRALGFDQHGRFLAAGPLLFADYLDLGSVASGHTLLQENLTITDLTERPAPDYRRKDPVYLAGGLVEHHLLRGISSLGVFAIIVDRAPEGMESALAASAPCHTEKYQSRAAWLRHTYREAGAPLPPFLRVLETPIVRWGQNPGQRYSLATLWIAKYEGLDIARVVTPGIERFDLSYADDLSLRFLTCYNTNLLHLLPDHLRASVLAAFHRHRIYPYAERDWQELDIIRRQVFVGGIPA